MPKNIAISQFLFQLVSLRDHQFWPKIDFYRIKVDTPWQAYFVLSKLDFVLGNPILD